MYVFSEKSRKKEKETLVKQPTIQRTLFIRRNRNQKRTKLPANPKTLCQQPAITALLRDARKKPIFNRLYNHFSRDSEERIFDNYARLTNFITDMVDLAFGAETLNGANAASWFDNRNAQGVIELNQNDPTFIAVRNAVMKNLHDKQYKTDKKHEVVPSADSPNITITRIQMIKNRVQLRQYQVARAEIYARTTQAGGSLNEAHLFAGFREEIANQIATNGHRPDIGAYAGGFLGKGHGALGRGAYFTDLAAKAISYSRGPNRGEAANVRQQPEDGTEHSFFLQDVLLGNVLYGNNFGFRHSHHNEMVRMQRNGQPTFNLMRPEGRTTGNVNGQPMQNFDSIVSAKTHEPGGGDLNILDRAINGSFDSNEYLVRNADQIYVKYRIYYQLVPNPNNQQNLPQNPQYPLTSIGNISVHANAVHLPRNWRWQQQQASGDPTIIL